jgi:hypothetical protein
MVFAAFHPERAESTPTQTASDLDLYNRVHSENPKLILASATGGSLEPGNGPTPGGTLEPPPTTKPQPTPVENNITNNNNPSARASSSAAARAAARSDSTAGAASSSNNSVRMNESFVAAPALGGELCGEGVSGGVSVGPFGIALGGLHPNKDCIAKVTKPQEDGVKLNFSVDSARTAIDGYDRALSNVDKAVQMHKQGDVGAASAHLDGANAQRHVSNDMATQSLEAAKQVLGGQAPADQSTGWGADIYAQSAPDAGSQATYREVTKWQPRKTDHPAKHTEAKKIDCKDTDQPKK